MLALLTRQPTWTRPWSIVMVSTVMLGIGCIDYFCGPDISLRPLYYIPIALAVSWLGWQAGTITSFAGLIIWLMSDYLAGSSYAREASAYWNSFITVATFLLLVGALQ